MCLQYSTSSLRLLHAVDAGLSCRHALEEEFPTDCVPGKSLPFIIPIHIPPSPFSLSALASRSLQFFNIDIRQVKTSTQ